MNTKKLTISGVFVALLLGSQLLLSGIAGIEIVTPLLLSFCFVSGPFYGVLVATAFSLIRCFLFGFYPTVIIDYLIYYNLFAIFFGFLGIGFKYKVSVIKHILITFFAVIFTAIFTLIDDIITPIFYGIPFKGYFISSLPVLIPQLICSAVSVFILFIPLVKILTSVTQEDGKTL